MRCILYLFSRNVHVQLLRQHLEGHPGSLRMFGFPFFAIFAS